MKNLRKILNIGVMTLTILGMTGLGSMANAAAPQAGDLIKMDGLSTVYFLGNDGKRYVYPTSSVYFSWHSDFSGVVTVSASELQSYPLGSNITVRPGTKLVKITTDPSVYAVEANGTLRKIASEADAIAIYGANWAKRVIDVPDAFFTNYTIGTPLTTGQIPAGTLVKNANSGAIYLYDGTNYRSIANEAAFNANRFDFANVITLANTITAGGTPITGAESLNYDAQVGPTNNNVAITGSGLTASISANTQPSTTIVSAQNANGSGQSIAPLASFNLTAANDGAITVKSIRLKRIGVSSDNSLSNVYLYNGNTKLTDAGSLSSGYVTFANANGIITVNAGQTVTVTVKADVAANANGNIGMEIESASDITSSGAAVSGSFPVAGNLMSITTVSDLATVTVNSKPTASGTTINAGTTAATLWSDNLNVGQKAVKLSYVSFRQIGSISVDAVQNLKLFVNGAQAGATASVDTNGRVNFDLSAAPVLLNTGASTVELRGDIVKGSSYNFTFSIQTASDMVLTDTNYGVNVALTGNTVSLPLSPDATTINAGNISIQRDPAFTSTQFVANQAQTVLGQWTLKAYGEDVKVQSLKVLLNMAGTAAINEGFNNVSVYVNGGTVGSSQNAVATAAGAFGARTLTFGTTNLFTIPAGTTVTVTVKGDSTLNSNTGITSAEADLIAPNQGFEGVNSFTYSPTIDTTYTGVSLTAGTSNATASANGSYTSQNLSGNTVKQKIGSFMIQASSADGVNVTSLKVGLRNASNTADLLSSDLTGLANLYIVTPDMTSGSNPVSPSALNNFSTNFTVAANQSTEVDVYADLSNTTLVPFMTTLIGNGNGSTSHQAVTINNGANTPAAAAGQVITVGTGSLSTISLSNSSPVKQIVVGGTTLQSVATYNFVASTAGGVTISELGFNGLNDAVSSVTVGGSTATVVNHTALVTGLNLVIPAGYGGLDVPVTANFAPVGLNGVTDKAVTLNLSHVKYIAGGTTTINDENGATTQGVFKLSIISGVAANPMFVAGVAPIVNLVAASGNLSTGVTKIGSVTVLAPTGSMTMVQLPLVLSASGATFTASSSIVVKDAATGNNITSTTNNGNGIAAAGGVATVTFNPYDTISSGTTAKTYDIYANVATIAGNAGTGRVTLGLSSTLTSFVWNDITAGPSGALLDASYIKNFPNTTVSIVN